MLHIPNGACGTEIGCGDKGKSGTDWGRILRLRTSGTRGKEGDDETGETGVTKS